MPRIVDLEEYGPWTDNPPGRMRNADPTTLRKCARWCRAEGRKLFMGNLHETSMAEAFEIAARHFEREARGALKKATRKPAKRKAAR